MNVTQADQPRPAAARESNPAYIVGGREPYRGKWRAEGPMPSWEAKAYAANLREAGWHDVVIGDLRDLLTPRSDPEAPPVRCSRGPGPRRHTATDAQECAS